MILLFLFCFSDSAELNLTPKEERSDLTIYGRIIINGQPGSNLKLFVYQTDRKGEYYRDSNGIAKIHGWLTTDKEGRFTIITIKPGNYPGGGVPAHVHGELYTDSGKRHVTLQFKGDPYLRSEKGVPEIVNGEVTWEINL